MAETLLSVLVGSGMIAFGVFCGVNALRLIYDHLKLWQNAARSKSWATTMGQIIKSTLLKTGARNSWRPDVAYRYRANGVEHIGHRIAFDYFDYSLREAQAKVERYSINASVPVYYDPEQPQESTLEQSARELGSGLLVLPLALFLPTGLCLCAGLFALADLVKQ